MKLTVDNSNMSLKEIEALEHKYLMKYWYFLKFAEEDIIRGLSSMNDIREDWEGKYGKRTGGKSLFDVGCERIVYALLNGKIAGQPNSCPVSSDLFFEVEDAYIHIDLKSVTTSEKISTTTGGKKTSDNIGDFNTCIFVGLNQNTYAGTIIKFANTKRECTEAYNPNLPTFYSKKNGDKKITLTYFVCMLNNSKTRECELVSLACMPNGKLEKHYGSRILKAGKNKRKADKKQETRFNFKQAPTFELLDENKKRVRIIYKNPKMSEYLKNKLDFYLTNFDVKTDE